MRVFSAILTPIIFAIGYYGVEVASQTDSSRSIWEAAKAGDVEAIEHHIKDGAGQSEPDTTGMTPLGWATAMGGVSAADVVLKHGADIPAKDPDAATTLHTAAFFGNVDMVQFLVTTGADMNAETVLGDAPLDAAGTDESSTVMLAELIGVCLGESQIFDGREEVFEFHTENNAEFGSLDPEEAPA